MDRDEAGGIGRRPDLSEFTFDLQRKCLLEPFRSMNIYRKSGLGRGCSWRSRDGSLTI